MTDKVFIITRIDPTTSMELFETAFRSSTPEKARLYVQNRAKIIIDEQGFAAISPKFYVRSLDVAEEEDDDDLVHVTVRSESYPYQETYGVAVDLKAGEVLGCTCPNYVYSGAKFRGMCKHMTLIQSRVALGHTVERL